MYTPGPWKYSRTHYSSDNYWYVITDSHGRGPIMDVGGSDKSGQIAEAKYLITNPEEIEANARLIACAPSYHETAYNLAVTVLQSDAYKDPEIKECVDAVLEVWKRAAGYIRQKKGG